MQCPKCGTPLPENAPFCTKCGKRISQSSGKNPRKVYFVAGVMVVIALLMVSGTAFASYQAEMWGGRSIPDVAGLDAASAKAELEGHGFTVHIEQSKADDGQGTTASTDPAAGQRREPGTTVTVYVTEPRIIPDIRGRSLDDVRADLEAEGARDIAVEEVESAEPTGTVLSISPDVGSTFSADRTVTIRVAQAGTIPDVVGKKQLEAESALKSAGYSTSIQWRESDKPAGEVVETKPAVGERLAKGGFVVIYIASPGPRDLYHMEEYLKTSPTDLSAYFNWKGYTMAFGDATTMGSQTNLANTRWDIPDVGWVAISPGWYNHHIYGEGKNDVLAKGSAVTGVRLTISSGEPATLETAEKYRAMAGFNETQMSCDESTVKLPADHAMGEVKVACLVGGMDGYVWAVEVTENEVVLMMGPQPQLSYTVEGATTADMLVYYDLFTA